VDREDVSYEVNELDAYALEEALRQKESTVERSS
jgi:electron transfer flavoprotein alpha/beta subunit